MRIQVVVPESQVTSTVLDAALEPVTRLNEQLLANGEVDTFDRAVKNGQVQWAPEPPGAERFDHAKTVTQRGWGDCDDLAPWAAASLRASGEDPGAKAVVKKSGPKRWHAVVLRSDGTIDDPSKRAGMGTNGNSVSGVGGGCPVVGAYGVAVPPMFPTGSSVVGGVFEVRPQIAVRAIPYGPQTFYQARSDMPWVRNKGGKATPTEYAMATLHTSSTAPTALSGSIIGAIRLAKLGGYALRKHVQRLGAIADACMGEDENEMRRCYGSEETDNAIAIVGDMGLLGADGPQSFHEAALHVMQHPDATDDEVKIAQMVSANAQGKRPDEGTLTAAVMRYMMVTQGPVTPGTAEEHARLLLADQVAKRIMLKLTSSGIVSGGYVVGDFDFGSFLSDVGNAVGDAANTVGKAVAQAAPTVAAVASVIPPPYGTAISLAASAVGTIAGKLTGSSGGGGGGGKAPGAQATSSTPASSSSTSPSSTSPSSTATTPTAAAAMAASVRPPGTGPGTASRICIPVTFG